MVQTFLKDFCCYTYCLLRPQQLILKFPDSSFGKESACNAGDPISLLGLGRSSGETDRLPTPVFLGFPVIQLVKNPLVIWETCVPSLVGKIPWRRERLPTPVFWHGEFHGLYSPWICKELDSTEQLSLSLHFHFQLIQKIFLRQENSSACYYSEYRSSLSLVLRIPYCFSYLMGAFKKYLFYYLFYFCCFSFFQVILVFQGIGTHHIACNWQCQD